MASEQAGATRSFDSVRAVSLRPGSRVTFGENFGRGFASGTYPWPDCFTPDADAECIVISVRRRLGPSSDSRYKSAYMDVAHIDVPGTDPRHGYRRIYKLAIPAEQLRPAADTP